MTAFRLGGQTVIAVRLRVPPVGPWHAECDFELEPDVSGRVTLELGALRLEGTIDATRSGTHAGQRRVRLVAGAGRWGTGLARRAYHSDGGVRALTVAQDAAREAGEQLDASAAPSAPSIGIDYVRTAGPAARALENAIGTALWWVGYDGVTRVGSRDETEAALGSYEVLDYDPRARIVTGAMDDFAAVGIGSVLTERLDEPQTVRELEIEASPGTLRFRAWTGGDASSRGQLSDAFRSAIERMSDRRIFMLCRYRVVRIAGERLELQAVNRDIGLPDVLPISMWPGVAGAHAELTPGAVVLVQFIEGDRTQPVVTHFAGKDGTGWSPVKLVLDASGAAASILAGANASKAPAWAEELRAELVKVAGALAAAQAPSGGGPLTWAPGSDYPALGVPTAAALGAQKFRCE